MGRPVMCTIYIVLGLTACKVHRGPAPQGSETRLQGEPTPAPPYAITYERPLAHRREVQGLVDSARTILARGDTASAPALLHRAAAFLLVQANAPTSNGTAELLATSAALDSLASHLPARPRGALRPLDALSARANLAEAERHAARAADAWSRQVRQPVADELIMTSDHIERAARDAGIALTPSMRHRLEELQVIVDQLPTRRELESDALNEVLVALHDDLAVMHARIGGARPAPGAAPR